jgi:lactate permease
VVLMRFWQPRDQPAPTSEANPETSSPAWKAWLPWIFLTGFVFAWGMPAVKNTLNATFAPKIPVPLLHQAVERMPPVVPRPEAEPALYTLNLLSATGTALLLGGRARQRCASAWDRPRHCGFTAARCGGCGFRC